MTSDERGSIRLSLVSSASVLCCHGAVTGETVNELREALGAARRLHRQVVVSAADVTSIGPAGLGVMLAVAQELRHDRRELRLVAPSLSMQRLLQSGPGPAPKVEARPPLDWLDPCPRRLLTPSVQHPDLETRTSCLVAQLPVLGRQRYLYDSVQVRWLSADPLAARLRPRPRHLQRAPGQPEWIAGLDLLTDGLRRPVGEGSVWLAPARDRLQLVLDSDAGPLRLELPTKDLAVFVGQLQRQLPWSSWQVQQALAAELDVIL